MRTPRTVGLWRALSTLMLSMAHTCIAQIESFFVTAMEVVQVTVEHAVDRVVASAHSFKAVVCASVRKVTTSRVSIAAGHVSMLKSRGYASA
ncbi:hypothetical protein PHACT_12635 [Pseudohongiella acticola]|uniref:Secreted protein n=1 Tax=Pseudohongiella acticola TaxID=1524254 RepID=A0A1E8CGQ8_9GAMM|nr:hypothetical protein [Pseudohongiella acticola]OFE11397.1 hypothetical protein PHACT_12635 [Pseudohongiella acticola]